MSKWIMFVEQNSAGLKTQVWSVISKDAGHGLGIVKWFTNWRCYSFAPSTNTIFEKDCLRDIAAFCDSATTQHRESNKMRRLEAQSVS